jgi:hypothetical protein
MHRTSFLVAVVLACVACGGDDTTTGGAGSTGQTGGTMTQGSGGSGGTSSAGGASGSGMAGSATAGGAAGTSASGGSGGTSGATDGGAKCSVLNPNACDTCVFTKCCDAYNTCALNDDCLNGMGQLAECVANDPSMSTQCYDDFATNYSMGVALRTCVQTNCNAPCMTVTP